jgi:hypothetical protein
MAKKQGLLIMEGTAGADPSKRTVPNGFALIADSNIAHALSGAVSSSRTV